MKINEMPPMLTGDTQTDIKRLHEWLVRLVNTLNEGEESNDRLLYK